MIKSIQLEKVKNIANKNLVLSFFEKLNICRTTINRQEVLHTYLSKRVTLEITKPYDKIEGVDGFDSEFLAPLNTSFENILIEPYILVGGEYENREYVSCTGNIVGNFVEDWHGIPANNQPAWLRFSWHFLIKDNKISKTWIFFDMIDVIRQAGYNLIPNRGLEHVPPGPMTQDGIVTYETDPKEGEYSIDLTNRMLTALGEYDGKSLESMDQTRFWDSKNMMWYGPSGIGTTRGLKGFEVNHQVPFITAFPDRGITEKVGEEYFTQIGDGNYSCDFGFPAMYGTHRNGGWLGVEPTGKTITLRVVDYWRREGDKLKENWVFIDIVDVLEQLGVDVFQLLKDKISQTK